MTTLILFLMACVGSSDATDTDDASTTDDAYTGDTELEAAVNLADLWYGVSPYLPQSDDYWCEDPENLPGTLYDEEDVPVTCWEEGEYCQEWIQFQTDEERVVLQARFQAKTCDTGEYVQLHYWKVYGDYTLTATDGSTDTLSVGGVTWTLTAEDDYFLVYVPSLDHEMSLAFGTDQWEFRDDLAIE